MFLNNLKDEDLIFLMSSGSKYAQSIFYKRYNHHSRELAKYYVGEFPNSGISIDEFYAVAFEAVKIAVDSYKKIKTTFYKYWKVIAKNAILDLVKKESYQYGARALAGISLDQDYHIERRRVSLHDVVGEDEHDNEISNAVMEEVYGENSSLSDEERLIGDLYIIKGFTPKEIMEKTGWNRNKFSYLLKKTKCKLQTLLKENYL